MKASIITIGDELLIGQVINTNSAWLASELTAMGFSIQSHLSISDRADDITETLERCLRDNDLLIFTGGLGPTNDDITKKVMADFFQSEMVFSDEILEHVEGIITGYGSSMNEKNREQALVPKAARILKNNHGTAPGMWFDRKGRVVISLPGVPREMKGIFNDCIKTGLTEHFDLPQLVYRTVMITGIAEAHLAQKLEDWEAALPQGLSVAYLPSPEAIRLRLGMGGEDRTLIDEKLQDAIDGILEIIPKHIFGYENESLEQVIGRMIAGRGGLLATAESCTGGMIAQKITAIPGCSDWFRGGVVAYSNEVKADMLGVKQETLDAHGAVSEETIREMVLGVKKVLNTDYAVATSGIAGPGGGSEEKPVGTVWIAAAGPDFLVARKFTFGKTRETNIKRSTSAAFNLLRLAMLEN